MEKILAIPSTICKQDIAQYFRSVLKQTLKTVKDYYQATHISLIVKYVFNENWLIPTIIPSDVDQMIYVFVDTIQQIEMATKTNNMVELVSANMDDVVSTLYYDMELIDDDEEPDCKNMYVYQTPDNLLSESNKFWILMIDCVDSPIANSLTIDTAVLSICNIYLQKQLHKICVGNNDFLGNVTHKIRTPLNSMLYTLKQLEEKTNDTGAINSVNNSAIQIANIISDIIDIKKIENNILKLNKNKLSIKRIIEDSIRIISTDAVINHVTIRYVIADDVPKNIYGDSQRIKQILVNLLNNSVKYCDKQKEESLISIDVSCDLITYNGSNSLKQSDSDSGYSADINQYIIKFKIIDNGIGISYDDQSKLFRSDIYNNIQHYYKETDDVDELYISSSGIGLDISKGLCKIMGGDLWLHNSEEDVGTEFHMAIQVVEENIQLTNSDTVKYLSDKNILILSNDLNQRLLIVNCLHNWCNNTQMCPTTEEAYMAYLNTSKCTIDLIIISDTITPMSADDFITKLKKSNINIPVIGINTCNYIRKPELYNDIIEWSRNKNNLIVRVSDLFKELGTSKQHASKINYKNITASILIVEDNIDNQIVLEKILKHIGYTKIDIKNNGKEALEHIKKYPLSYQILLIDIKMPLMNGIVLNRRIKEYYKEINKQNDMPIMIGISAQPKLNDYTDHEMIFDDFIPKPIDVCVLRDVLSRIRIHN